MNSEDRIIELIAKFTETGEISINEFKSAVFSDYSDNTVLSLSPIGIVNWGVIDTVEESSDEYIRHYTITTSKKIQYNRKVMPTEI